MAVLKIIPTGEEIELLKGESVADALKRGEVAAEFPCNGEGICGQCAVWVISPEGVPETPHDGILPKQADKGLRLACQLKPDTDMTIRLRYVQRPEVHKAVIADEYIAEEFEEEGEVVLTSPYNLNVAARVVDEGGHYFLQYRKRKETSLDNWSKRFSPKGVAVDVGTTTIVASLMCLETGEELATHSCLNPQVQYGHDVMTRIQMGSTEEGLMELSGAVRQAINELMEKACDDADANPHEILDGVIGGNTAMLQLCGAIDPEPLGRLPFEVGIESGRSYPARKFGLIVNPAARVYVPPVAHAFVGSDISAGLLTCEGFFDPDQTVLFIDVGTNGELGLSVGERFLVTSTAAGPAFEGSGISCGMRAEYGAVDTAYVIKNGDLVIKTIGDGKPTGVCGSGIIDLIAMLLEQGAIDHGGRIKERKELDGVNPEVAVRIKEYEDTIYFDLGNGVYLSQQDIRQVQLAKSAIRTAIDMFLEETGVEELDKVIIGGGFGHSLSTRSLEKIGMIPRGFTDRVWFSGNTSKEGCARLLLDRSKRRYIEEEMAKVEHLSLAERPEFMERYIDNMEFPLRSAEFKNGKAAIEAKRADKRPIVEA